MNVELFKKIQAEIATEGNLVMSEWEFVPSSPTACGTSRCLAGWAIYKTTGAPVFEYRTESDYRFQIGLSAETKALAEELDVDPDVPEIAAKLLGLTPQQKDVFYGGDVMATEFVDLVVAGLEEEANAVLDEDFDE